MPDYDALEVIRDIIQENNLKLNDKELTNKIKKKLNVRHWTVSDDEILISFIDEIRKQDHATEPLSSLLTRDSTLRINSILEPLDITSSDEDEDDDKNDKDDNKYNHDDILELFEEIMSPILKDCKGLKPRADLERFTRIGWRFTWDPHGREVTPPPTTHPSF